MKSGWKKILSILLLALWVNLPAAAIVLLMSLVSFIVYNLGG